MLPIRDVIPSRTTPGVTLLLLAMNVIMFGVSVATSDDASHPIGPQFGLPDGETPRLTDILSLFRHASLVHLAGNLTALWLFGENVEDRFGHLRFLLCYLGVGYAAALSATWVAPTPVAPPTGATGAIAGIVAAYLLMFPRSRVLAVVPTGLPLNLMELPAAAVAAGWFLLQVARGTGPLPLFVGAAAGVLAAWLLRRPERQRVEWWAE